MTKPKPQVIREFSRIPEWEIKDLDTFLERLQEIRGKHSINPSVTITSTSDCCCSNYDSAEIEIISERLETDGELQERLKKEAEDRQKHTKATAKRSKENKLKRKALEEKEYQRLKKKFEKGS